MANKKSSQNIDVPASANAGSDTNAPEKKKNESAEAAPKKAIKKQVAKVSPEPVKSAKAVESAPKTPKKAAVKKAAVSSDTLVPKEVQIKKKVTDQAAQPKSKVTEENGDIQAPEVKSEPITIKKAAAKKTPAKKTTAKTQVIAREKGGSTKERVESTKEEANPKTKETANPAAPITASATIANPEAEVRPKEGTSETQQLSSTNSSSLRKITFQVKFTTTMGQSLYVTGNHPLLGHDKAEEGFALTYLNEDYWYGTLELEDQPFTEVVTYNYVLKNTDGTYTKDWGNDKQIEPSKYKTEEVLFIDTWNPSSLIENTFYTEPFQEVLLKENFTPVASKSPATVTHTFRVKAPLLAKGQALCIVGSIAELGEWSTEEPLLLSNQQGEPWHTVSLDLSDANFPFAYKYGVYDVNNKQFLQFESGTNRVLYVSGSEDRFTQVSDGFAAIPYQSFKGAGVAIPVFSLRSKNSFGVGEFTDLKLLVDWAKQVGLKLVQLLPVNDTTATHQYTDSYPYAAISAFALHPLYLHLPSIVNRDNKKLLDAMSEQQQQLNTLSDVDYVAVMAAKWDLIKQIFPSQKEATFKTADFKNFFDENAHWLVPYAAFSYFREKYNTSDFNAWPSNQTYNAEEINALAGSPMEAEDAISMYYYVQYHLHLQLRDAADYAHANGIIVKGDIPIGIYRNSCDAWQEPELYNMDKQAGAPPDDFAVKGQNWGFPTYNWQRMREDGFTWWKRRFHQMSYYFDAFRIDHILGFFRIWSIPMDAVEGIMGHFVPALPVHINEFHGRGFFFDHARMCRPFINDRVLWETFGSDANTVKLQFLNESHDGQYNLKEEFDSQRKVEGYFAEQESNEHNNKLKQGLYDLISNVLLFEVENSNGLQFHFRISMEDTASFRELDHHAQGILRELYLNYFYRRQDDFWMKEAMLKLPELKRSTNMLICGEDLGMVPATVPVVMHELAILSLEIQRMPKDPKRQFFHPNDAPYLSVVTPSTHDMSTIRGWWEEDREVTQKFFNTELGQWGTAPFFCEPWIARTILVQHFYSPAMWSIFQLQDLMSISPAVRRENPNEERINIPADPKHYWRYRMHLSLEDLMQQAEFNGELRNLVEQSGR